MSAMSNYLENKFLDHFRYKQHICSIGSLHWITLPTLLTGTGAELSGNGYARQLWLLGQRHLALHQIVALLSFLLLLVVTGVHSLTLVFMMPLLWKPLFHAALTASKTINDGTSLR